MQHSESLTLGMPSLPKGGGAITGLSSTTGAAGPDGAATLTLPLPITPGRGYAPAMALTYSSQAGNGPFGMGWSAGTMSIRRRTRFGVPAYDDQDEFLAPSGEVLVVACREDGRSDIQVRRTLTGVTLAQDYRVTTYRTRVEQDFTRLEYWQSGNGTGDDFWVMYPPDGQVLLLGYGNARIADPDDTRRTAQWLLFASVALNGEQICYQYRAEDDAGCNASELAVCPQAGAQRYLQAVYYGNRTASSTLPGLDGLDPVQAGWLFILVFDYGERGQALSNTPTFEATADWPCRADCFSGFEYGFSLRTRRLCRQVLMFHRLATLTGEADGDDTPALVSRLVLTYEDNPSASMLRQVQQVASEQDGTLRMLPPLTFSWQTFDMPASPEWLACDALQALNGEHPYQFVDLYGEGLAGVLYQDTGAWWYRPPVRQSDVPEENATTFGQPLPLPSQPSLQAGAMLTDLNGDGRLQWVVTANGVSGEYSQHPESPGQWLHFTPLNALPVEYHHPRAQLADLMGGGFSDLVLLGPRSVRLYRGQENSWSDSQTVVQSAGVTLPVPGADPCSLVAFSDPAGSGQQHLIQVRADGVTWWPNLGQGRFGQPIDMPGFNLPPSQFNPDQVFLADIDGSGTADLIYAQADALQIWPNQCGNRFGEPLTVRLPVGVRFDRTCQLRVADIRGLGVATLLLSSPHPTPRHYLCHLASDKPWLLNGMENSMGARHTLHYRSSAQYWLDEKAGYEQQGAPVSGCRLPFPLHLLAQTEALDDITGSRLSGAVTYRHGAWDAREREFLGFGCVEVLDTLHEESDTALTVTTPPSLTRTWYATGIPEMDSRMLSGVWQGDAAAFSRFEPCFTTGSGTAERPCDEATRLAQAFWLHRGLKGLPLRSEVYGQDDNPLTGVPYSVTEHRLQVRLVSSEGQTPVVLPSVRETRTYQYERLADDPQCSQQVTLLSDHYGLPLEQVSVAYPRRGETPLPAAWAGAFPETLPDDCRDEQQLQPHLTLTRSRWHHLIQEDGQVLGLPDATSTEVRLPEPAHIPPEGFTAETLTSLLSALPGGTLSGQQQTWYLDASDSATTRTPSLPPRVAFVEHAVLDEQTVAALPSVVTPSRLEDAGYRQAPLLFPHPDTPDATVWTARTGYTRYAGAACFHVPVGQRHTMLTGETVFIYDPHDCVVVGQRDAAGLTLSQTYDWRFLTPVSLTDENGNRQHVVLDALSRVRMSWFYGTENGSETGFSGPDGFTCPANATAALALTGMPVALCQVYVTDSWMLAGPDRLPPHTVTLMADRYDRDPQQQLRQQVVFSDGFGRVLQAAARQAPGEAWSRRADGALATRPDGAPVTVDTGFRWAVSGRTEYDNKGQPVRTYQPYFLDDWRYLSNDSAREDLWADTVSYDPPGRAVRVVTALGHERRTWITPWFTVEEDENDTLT
jgi:hypothetical protein